MSSDRDYSYAGWAKAFTIFAKYDGFSTFGEVSAAHDELWAGPPPRDVSPEDLAQLEVLGWTPDEENECFHNFV